VTSQQPPESGQDPILPGNYDVTADGTRFVMVEMLRGAEAPDLRVVTNWLGEVRAKLP